MRNRPSRSDGSGQSGLIPLLVVIVFVGALLAAVALAATHAFAATRIARPTVVLVHDDVASAPSWNRIAARLIASGYPVVAVVNPLRGVPTDPRFVTDVVTSVEGPVIVVHGPLE